MDGDQRNDGRANEDPSNALPGEWDWFDALPEDEKRDYAKFRAGNRYDDNAQFGRNIMAVQKRKQLELEAEDPDEEIPPPLAE